MNDDTNPARAHERNVEPTGSTGLRKTFAGPRAFHVMIKPTGPACNLSCAYCFYLGKGEYYPGRRDFRMSPEVLESFIRQYIEAQEVPEVTFGWQGGEPTLLGLDFFRKAIELQRKYVPPGMRLINAFQTNGTLLDDDWCRFFREHDFLIGISLDGPKELHDKYRRDKSGCSTFERVMRGLRLLQKHSVEYNVLCVVHRANGRRPLGVYRFFKEQGVGFLQFIPLVERLLPSGACVRNPRAGRDVSEATVSPKDYGRFLCTIYDEWVRHDVGRIHVQMFEAAFASTLGNGPGLCLFEPMCGRAMALEHNGDLYSCDHFVHPEYRLGNILKEPLVEIVDKPFQTGFRADKRDTLPTTCRECSVLSLCRGECPKNRFLATTDGQPGLNYLCEGLKTFFRHATPTLDWMARAYGSGRAPAEIMKAFEKSEVASHRPRENRGEVNRLEVGRNEPCPCGSGKKFKRCCGG
jgi:uncharacterized protein